MHFYWENMNSYTNRASPLEMHVQYVYMHTQGHAYITMPKLYAYPTFSRLKALILLVPYLHLNCAIVTLRSIQ